jgi:hypothetical protein
MEIYKSREFKDRVVIGDNKYTMETLPDGRVLLTPSPDQVIEVGTPLNRECLQIMEDRIVLLMNRVFNGITMNPFIISFKKADEFTGNGVWNESAGRIEC